MRARVCACVYTRSVHRAQMETGRTNDGTVVCNANVSGTCPCSRMKRETLAIPQSADFNLILRRYTVLHRRFKKYSQELS